jgi:hypothetical protein
MRFKLSRTQFFGQLICRITAGATSVVDAEDGRIEKDQFQQEASGSSPLVQLPTALIDPSSSNSAPALILSFIPVEM